MSLLTIIKNLFGFKSKGSANLSKRGPNDRVLCCEDCRTDFIFDEGEQRFFKAKGFTDPKRCTHCRKKVRSSMRKGFRGRRGGGGGGQRNSSSRRDSLIDGDSPYADER